MAASVTHDPCARRTARPASVSRLGVPGLGRCTIAVLWLALILGHAGEAAAQALVVQGGCRDGQPHGAWQLADATGRIRVLGAFNRGKRTGSFIHWNEEGVRIAHLPYEEDARNGTLALWYPSAAKGGDAQQRLEAIYAAGKLNGTVRIWTPGGRLRGEYRYAAGDLVEAAAWDARGHALPPQQARAQAEEDVARSENDQRALEQVVERHAQGCGTRPAPTLRQAAR
jgi:hypothetical protein